jgi:hypothetical protein
MNGDFGLKVNFCDPTEIFTENFLLDFELMLVVGVLVMAPAAEREVGAGWWNAARGGLEDFYGVSAGETGFVFGDCGFDFFSGQNEGGEDGFAAALRVGW